MYINNLLISQYIIILNSNSIKTHRIKMIAMPPIGITFFRRSPYIILIYYICCTHCTFGGHFALGGYLISLRSYFMFFFCPLLFLSPGPSSLLLKTERTIVSMIYARRLWDKKKKWRPGRHAEAVKNYSGCARIRTV